MPSEDHGDLAEALEHIDPASLDYQGWATVGMALHESGLDVSLWDGWSRRDPKRYKPGECERKWAGFGNGQTKVHSGTIVKMARDNGWVPGGENRAYAWDEEIYVTPRRIVDAAWTEPSELPQTGDKTPEAELLEYMAAVFQPDDVIGYVCDSWDNGGRLTPKSRGVYTRTAGEVMEALRREPLAVAVGGYDHNAGAWIRFNPLDGKGVGNADVTEYRYALVESDTVDKGMQLSIIRELQLPCAAIVDSGNKSLHAIVHVDAADEAEYRKRVELLYETCKKNGLEVDEQNKNPSRLSRMPGFDRGSGHQALLATNEGKRSWGEWLEWLQEETDDLPDATSLADVWDDMPELAEPLIDGLLRRGHKMLIAGPSKAGKSFALIELCIALAEGGDWLGYKCAQGRVLYVNLELDAASCLHRFRDVYAAMGTEPANLGNIDVWNLRGCAVPMDRLAPSLIRRALKTRPVAVVIDPIYKVITGDENSAGDMAAFCNQFDKIARQVGCAVIYCHHHSKGAQGAKRSIDRASGSGVFARDPDALLDIAPLDLDADTLDAERARAKNEATMAALDAARPGWRDECEATGAGLLMWANNNAVEAWPAISAAHADVDRQSQGWTAWRVDATLREFPGTKPTDMWFKWPLHEPDGTGALAELAIEGDDRTRHKTKAKTKADDPKKAEVERVRAERVGALRAGMAACASEGVPATRANVCARMPEVGGEKVTMDALRSWTRGGKWCPIATDANGLLVDGNG